MYGVDHTVMTALQVGIYQISGSGWVDIRPFYYPIPAEMLNGNGYHNRIFCCQYDSII